MLNPAAKLTTKVYPDSFFNAKDFFVVRDRFDYGPFPIPYYFLEWLGRRAEKKYGAKLSSVLASSKGAFHKGLYRNIFGSKKDWDLWTNAILNKTRTSPKFVKTLFQESKVAEKKLRDFSLRLLKLDPRQLDAHHLTLLQPEWIKLYSEYSFYNIPVWFGTGDNFATLLIKTLQDLGLPENDIQILTTCPYPSYVYKEELGLLKVGLKSGNLFKTALTRHERDWRWLPFDYIGPTIWTKTDFLKKLKELAPTKKANILALKEKRDYFVNLRKTQNHLAKKYNLSKNNQQLLHDLHLITLMQDEKKEVCTLAQFSLQKVIFTGIAAKLKIKPLECIKFHYQELEQALKGNINIKTKLKNRLEGVTVILKKDGISIIDGLRARKIFDKFSPRVSGKFLKGQTASAGKAKGRAKILMSPMQIAKVKKGNILIAPMTTPDFILGMKRAAAIVTDEGGMTSHAAIVSRELGIPCLVGTLTATKTFKDGDLVEVDANKGLIRKLK